MTNPNGESLAQKYAEIIIDRIEDNQYGKSASLESMVELRKLVGAKSNKAALEEALKIVYARGYIRKMGARARYRVMYPRFEIPGLTANFTEYIEKLGFKTTQVNIVEPHIESVTPSLAALYSPGLLTVGDQVVRRERLQGILDPDVNLRIGKIFYPVTIAQPYMNQLLHDPHFDMLKALQADGIVLARERFSINARIPHDQNERSLLRVGNLHPLLDVRRVGYAENGSIITFHWTVMNASHFRYDFEREVPYFKTA